MDRSVSLFIRNHVFYFEKTKIDRVSRVERSPAVPPDRVAVVFTSGESAPLRPVSYVGGAQPSGNPFDDGSALQIDEHQLTVVSCGRSKIRRQDSSHGT